MRLRRPKPLFRLLMTVVLTTMAWLLSTTAQAARPAESKSQKEDSGDPSSAKLASEYEIQPGDTLLSIALAHGVKLSELLEANGIENPDKINAGLKLHIPQQSKWGKVTKAGVIIAVPKGFSISRIADAYEVKSRDILKANKLTNPNKVRAGQKLLIPGARAAIELVPPPPCYKPKVELYRMHTGESQSVSLCFCNGRPTPEAVAFVSRLSSAPGAPDYPLNPRIVELLQSLAEQFPQRRIELVSGYRQAKQKASESRHTTGDALDFRLTGLPNKQLSEALRRFADVGVGYYPNSSFVHLDSRDTAAYWVDYSRPGEKAIYGPSDMSSEELSTIRDRRRLPVEEQLAAATEDAIRSITQAVERAAQDIEVEPEPAPSAPDAAGDDATQGS